MEELEPKVIAAARRRPGMTHGEYEAYVRDVHGGLTRKDPVGLVRYVQNHAYDGAFGSAEMPAYVDTFHRDSVTELYFPNFAEMGRTFASDYVRTVIAPDGANFAEVSSTLTLVTRETIVREPPASHPGTKILHFLFASEDAAVAQSAWQAAHDRAIARSPDFGSALKGVVRSDALPASASDILAHFGNGGNSAPVLVASLWLDDDHVPLFRSYEQELMTSPEFDRSRSFFIFTRPVEIL